MSNRAGSALALPGVARISPDAHANACNTASRTKPLFVLMNSPMYIVLVLRLCMSRLISTTPEGQKPPSRFFNDALFGRSFDVDVALAIAPDGRAESVLQHGQKRFRPFGARLKCSSDGQL